MIGDWKFEPATVDGVAVDAGTVINPRHVRAQMEGGTIYGLSNALYGAITAKEIRVTGQEWTFAPTVAVPQDFRWGRMDEVFPEIARAT